jgi:biopolymer transport protein ExbD
MADIFMILLVFLLKSFSMTVTNIAPTSNMILPEAEAKDEVTENLKLEITDNVILLDDQPVTTLEHYKLQRRDMEGDGTSRSLNQALIKERIRRPASADNPDTSPPKDPRLMILADQDTPYQTIRAVLASAGNSGFSDFKLVVVQDN